jgi:DNA-damage-inducible protein D
MVDQPIFSSEPGDSIFEKNAHSNDVTYWFASDVMRFLGYEDKSLFNKAKSKAQMACANLEIPVEDNFIACKLDDGTPDTKLTRFACYLVAMNADSRIQQVAKAQVYFASLAESVRQYFEHVENVARIQIRGDVSDRERSLAGIAKESGVSEWGLFQNSGYRGMYNMNLFQLRNIKGVPSNRSPLDFMGKVELAANLFRITQTEEKIRNGKIQGQKNLESAAEEVGREVRNTMKKIGGSAPEDLLPAEDIRTVKKEIKQTHRKMKKLDNKPKKKK